MPTMQGRASGVQVKDDNGRMLGVAHSGGEGLTSEDALRQLGYELDPESADGSGVRFLGATGGGLSLASTLEADRAAAAPAVAEAAATQAAADAQRITELEAQLAAQAETLQAARAANVSAEADLAAARGANQAASEGTHDAPQA